MDRTGTPSQGFSLAVVHALEPAVDLARKSKQVSDPQLGSSSVSRDHKSPHLLVCS